MGKRGPKIKQTAEFVINELQEILKTIEEDEDILAVGELLVKRGFYNQKLSEWLDTYTTVQEIPETIKKIKSILEHRINSRALLGKLNPTMSIFNLKNNYGWKDKVDVEATGKDGGPVNIKVEFV